ncbi:prepilin peptidase [Cohnella fermenti]|uniref:Prepilin peptidase n=1 Tax=Cohnella fermenti TaxID=2565925 RepID=A0A4S4C3V0_9BACL|nr:A24 family peptidase [Cohnella fermenti]THF82193.1 prepilin peptidase [Cohnella fermenti]
MIIPDSSLILAVGMLGLLIGSFLNVVAIRVPEGLSVVWPESRCMNCGASLRKLDLVPVLNYCWLRGRARCCGTRISPKYPIYELATALLFGLYASQIGWQSELAPALLFISILVVIVQTDLSRMIIPDKVLLVGAIVIVPIRLFWSHPLPLWNYAAAGVGISALLFAMAIVSNGGIGGGDIKLFLLIGLFLGIASSFMTLIVASILGFAYGLAVRMVRKDRSMKYIPFGPFIALAGIFACLWGERMLIWYRDVVAWAMA